MKHSLLLFFLVLLFVIYRFLRRYYRYTIPLEGRQKRYWQMVDKLLQGQRQAKKTLRRWRFWSAIKPPVFLLVLDLDQPMETWLQQHFETPLWQHVEQEPDGSAVGVVMMQEAIWVVAKGPWCQRDEQADATAWQRLMTQLNRKVLGQRLTAVIAIVDGASLTQQLPLNHLDWQSVYPVAHLADAKGNLPFWLVVEGLEHYPGFETYLRSLPTNMRQQPWGFQLPANPNKPTKQWLKALSQGYNGLCQRLDHYRLSALAQHQHTAETRAIWQLPYQLMRLQSPIMQWLKKVTHSHCLQGLYWGAASNHLALTTSALKQIQKIHEGQQQRPLLHHLFQHRRQCCFFALGLTAIVMLTWFYQCFQTENTLTAINRLQAQYHYIATEEPKPQPGVLPLSAMTTLWRMQHHYIESINPFWQFLGLALPQSVQRPLQQQYRQMLSNSFQVFLQHQLAQHLQDLLKQTPNAHGLKRYQQRLYQGLSAYLMLSEVQHLQASTLRQVIAPYWRNQWHEKPQIQRELMGLLADWSMLKVQAMPMNHHLVATARQRLGHQPLVMQSYLSIMHEHFSKTPIPSLQSSGQVVRALWSLPGFRYHDWVATIRPAIKPTLLLMQKQQWVLGRGYDHPLSQTRLLQLQQQVSAQYWQDYKNYWLAALGQIQLASPKNLTQLSSRLALWLNNTAAWQQVLYQVQQQTSATRLAPVEVQAQSVIQRFQQLNQAQVRFIVKMHVLPSLQRLHQQIKAILSAKIPDQAAYQQLVSMSQRHNTALQQLWQAGQTLPSPVNHWLQMLYQQIVTQISLAADRWLIRQWQQQVGPECQQVVIGKQPFQVQAHQSASWADVQRLFNREGPMQHWVQRWAAVFMQQQKGQWAPVPYPGIQQWLPKWLWRDILIQKGLQRSIVYAGARPDQLKVIATPLYLSKQLARFSISVAGKTQVYENGPRLTVAWPWWRADQNTHIQLHFDSLNGQSSQQHYQGPWAWIALLHHSVIDRLSPTVLEVKLQAANGGEAVYSLSLSHQRHIQGLLGIRHFRCTGSLTE